MGPSIKPSGPALEFSIPTHHARPLNCIRHPPQLQSTPRDPHPNHTHHVGIRADQGRQELCSRTVSYPRLFAPTTNIPPCHTLAIWRSHLRLLSAAIRSLPYYLALTLSALQSIPRTSTYTQHLHIPWLRAPHRRLLTPWILEHPRTPRLRMRPSLAVPRHPACLTSRKVCHTLHVIGPSWRAGQSN
jgi:hypothetical protein